VKQAIMDEREAGVNDARRALPPFFKQGRNGTALKQLYNNNSFITIIIP